MTRKPFVSALLELIVAYLPEPNFRLRRWIGRLLPTPGNTLFTLLVVAGLLWVTNAGALPLPAPAAATTSTGTIAYQGRLADSAGNPITETVNMEFRLYDIAEGGAPLWSELWTGSNAVRVSDGLFNVMLGSLNQIPQNVITENDQLYLGITVGTDDEMSPRVQLGSVPFAVQALTVPDGSMTTSKLADEAVTAQKVASGAIHYQHMSLSRYRMPNVSDHFPLAGEEQLLSELTIDVPYPATYMIYLIVSANGHGGRSIFYLRDATTGKGLGGLSHTSSNVLETTTVIFADFSPGIHTLKLTARTASSYVGQEVRAGTHAVVMPIAQSP